MCGLKWNWKFVIGWLLNHPLALSRADFGYRSLATEFADGDGDLGVATFNLAISIEHCQRFKSEDTVLEHV